MYEVEKNNRGRAVGQKLVGDRTVDTQHGTDAEGSSHPCTKGYYPGKDFFHLLPHM
jgi:hypothetical protein